MSLPFTPEQAIIKLFKRYPFLVSVGAKSRIFYKWLMRKFQFQGLRSLKIRSLLVVNDYFLGERNEEIEAFAQALVSKLCPVRLVLVVFLIGHS